MNCIIEEMRIRKDYEKTCKVYFSFRLLVMGEYKLIEILGSTDNLP